MKKVLLIVLIGELISIEIFNFTDFHKITIMEDVGIMYFVRRN